MTEAVYYSVVQGRKTGIFICRASDFEEKVRVHTDGFSNNIHKRHDTLEQAKDYMHRHGSTTYEVHNFLGDCADGSDRIVESPDTASARLPEDDPVEVRADGADNCPRCYNVVGDDSPHPWCEGCQKWFHLWCLKTTAEQLPKGDYFCPACLIGRAGNNSLEVLLQDPPAVTTRGEENLCTRCNLLEKELTDLRKSQSRWQIIIQSLEEQLEESQANRVAQLEKIKLLEQQVANRATAVQIPEPEELPGRNVNTDDAHGPVELSSVLERLRQLENKQEAMEITSDMLIKRMDRQEARVGGRWVAGDGEGNGGSSIVFPSKEGGEAEIVRAGEGSVGNSDGGKGGKWRVVRRKRGKRKGGQSKGRDDNSEVIAQSESWVDVACKGARRIMNHSHGNVNFEQGGVGKGKKGREVRFEMLADSHGRGLSNLLKGVDVTFKPGARMERVVEGAGREGTSCTVIMGGTNDVSVYGVRKGLFDLRERLGENRRVIIVGVPHRHDEPYPNVDDLILRKNNLLKDFCDFHGYEFLNVDDSKRHYFTNHGLHFNVTGKRWLANKIQTAVNFL